MQGIVRPSAEDLEGGWCHALLSRCHERGEEMIIGADDNYHSSNPFTWSHG